MIKRKHSYFALLILVMLFVTSTSHISAKTLSVEYKSIPGRFMWATSPEIVRSKEASYVYGSSVNTDKYLDVEIYNHNYTGDKTLRFGVVVYNNNYSSVTLSIAGNRIATHNMLVGGEKEKLATIVEQVILPFVKGSGSGTITIPPKSSKFVMFTDVKPGYLVNGRVSMKSNKTNVYARVVHGPTYTDPAHYFTLTEQEQGNDFCGILSYIGKNAVISNAKIGDTFYLFEHPKKNNVGEYDGVESAKSPGHSYCLGNFSMIYDLTFDGGAGKTLKITPNTYSDGGRILFNNNGVWYSTSFNTSSNSWNIPLGSDGDLKLLLPSGNYSNMKAQLIN